MKDGLDDGPRRLDDVLAREQRRVAGHGVAEYVVLGAGLDTFAQRRPDIASRLRVFEVDRLAEPVQHVEPG